MRSYTSIYTLMHMYVHIRVIGTRMHTMPMHYVQARAMRPSCTVVRPSTNRLKVGRLYRGHNAASDALLARSEARGSSLLCLTKPSRIPMTMGINPHRSFSGCDKVL